MTKMIKRAVRILNIRIWIWNPTYCGQTQREWIGWGVLVVSLFLANAPIPGFDGLLATPARSVIAESKRTDEPNRFQFYFVDGRVLTAEVEQTHLDWNQILDNGETKQRKISLANIDRLLLTESPAANQFGQVHRLIKQLNDPDYWKREAAEVKLSDPSFGVPFLNLITQRANDPQLEVRFRLQRVISKLAKKRVLKPLRFDTLVLKTGKTVKGDAGQFSWPAKFLGQPIPIRRDELSAIGSETAAIDWSARATGPVKVRLTNDHVKFVDKTMTTIDFSVDPDGYPLLKRADVEKTFVAWGLRFRPVGPGFVGIPTFKFDSLTSQMPVGGRSIARFNATGGRGIAYKGVVEFEFCLPGQPRVPAGVMKFGTFIATVKEPRAFVLEAFDEHDRLIGTVESLKADCGFMGIESTVPIHRIQVRANPFLQRVDGAVDEDFALDTFYFTPPQPVALPMPDQQTCRRNASVVLTDGTRLSGSLSFAQANVVEIRVAEWKKFSFEIDQISQIAFARRSGERTSSWMATVKDGSTVAVDPWKGFLSEWLGKISPDDMVCLFHGRVPKRFPVDGDFQNAKAVLVFPTCRIPVPKMTWQDTGFSWPENAKKRLQPVDEESPLGIPGKDPTPQASEIDFQATQPQETPTVWLQPPQSTTDGWVRLTDGQRLSLGQHRRIEKINNGWLILKGKNGELTIELKRVDSLIRPVE